jgi:hypothetical protein
MADPGGKMQDEAQERANSPGDVAQRREEEEALELARLLMASKSPEEIRSLKASLEATAAAKPPEAADSARPVRSIADVPYRALMSTYRTERARSHEESR